MPSELAHQPLSPFFGSSPIRLSGLGAFPCRVHFRGLCPYPAQDAKLLEWWGPTTCFSCSVPQARGVQGRAVQAGDCGQGFTQ